MLRETDYSPAHQSQALVHAELVALFKHELKSNAETYDRLALRGCFEHQVVQLRLAQASDTLPERTHARQYQSVGLSNPDPVACHRGFDSHCLERFFDASKVADSVIDY